MSFTLDKVYNYHKLTEKITEHVVPETGKVIGITGTSCVGKSTFSKLLKSKLEERGLSVQLIRADNYLKKKYRAEEKFWNYADDFLKPAHFDWNRLWKDIEQLRRGEDVRRKCYVRGIGWKRYIEFKPADFFIIEGLFLDSKEASVDMKYNLLVALTAKDELIKKRRMERDDYYREHFKDYKRTKEETLKELENTLQAGKAYQIYTENWNYMKLTVQRDFHARITEYHKKKEGSI